MEGIVYRIFSCVYGVSRDHIFSGNNVESVCGDICVGGSRLYSVDGMAYAPAFGEPIGEKCGHAVLSDRAFGAADQCKDHGILPYCTGILCIALQRLLLGAAGSRPVSSLYRANGQSGMVICGGLPAEAICQSPQGGGYCDGGFFDAVCSQLGMASLRRGRSAYCQKDI